MIFSVIRTGLLFGPNINNMFSKLFATKLSALTPGASYNQYIHEEDLGEPLYLTYVKDLPGAYNVGADDAISTRFAFERAGVKIITLPAFLLKWLAAVGFLLGIFPAGPG